MFYAAIAALPVIIVGVGFCLRYVCNTEWDAPVKPVAPPKKFYGPATVDSR